MMDAPQLLRAYAQIIGVANLRFDAGGCARLEFGDSAAVNFEIDPSRESIHLYAVLGPLPAADPAGLCRRLLEGNLFCAQTRGATLAIDAVRQEALICRRVEL